MLRSVALVVVLALAATVSARVATVDGLVIAEDQSALEGVPGTTVRAVFHVTNVGSESVVLQFLPGEIRDLEMGEDPPRPPPLGEVPYAATASPSIAEVPPGGTVTVRLDVEVPEDAEVGDRRHIVLFVGAPPSPPTAIAEAQLTVVAPDLAVLGWVKENAAALAAGAAVVAGAALLREAARRDPYRFAPLAALFTRFSRAKVLDHATRERIHAAIQGSPGVNYATLKRDLGLNAGALVHHLRMLEQHGLVISRREGHRRRFYPVDVRLPPVEEDPLTPTQARIVAMLDADGLTRRVIADRLGTTQQGANWHLKTLERRGAIEVRYVDGEWRCYRSAPSEGAV